jgi:hypothetical protein
MRKLHRSALVALGAALLTSACAPARLTVKPEFWNDHQAKIGVALTPHPTGAAHKVGAQGLLDMAINSAVAGSLQEHLSKVDLAEFDRVRDRFVEELGKRGMSVVAIPGYVDPASFPKRGDDAPAIENAYGRDLAALRAKHHVDVVVLLQVSRFGTIRSYYGFIPLGAPSGFFEVKGQMVDLKTGQLLWQTQLDEKAASVPAEGDWDQPPDYPNLTAALRAAVANGNAFLVKEFFTTPPPATPAATPVAGM